MVIKTILTLAISLPFASVNSQLPIPNAQNPHPALSLWGLGVGGWELTEVDRATTIQSTPVSGTWRIRLQENWNWTRANGERWVSIQMRRDDDRSFGMSVPLRELEGAGISDDRLSASGVRFTLKRDAGTIDFRGSFDNGRGIGDFTFAPDAEFVRAMQARERSLTADDILKLAIHDVSRTFIQSIEAQGYKDLDLDQLVKMRIHGVDADYIAAFRKAGYDKLTVEELIKTRIHGATPTFVQEMRAAGFDKLSINELVKMRIHGVSPSFIREMRDMGFKDLNIEDLVKMRIHGVSASFVKEMRDLGYKDIEVEDLVKMRIHGVTPQFIRELKELGYGSVRKEELVRFRIHGVTADFIRDVRAAGFKDMTPDDLVDFSIHGRRWLSKR
jgi:predicted metallopeptidase